jgi:hypothetical protein
MNRFDASSKAPVRPAKTINKMPEQDEFESLNEGVDRDFFFRDMWSTRWVDPRMTVAPSVRGGPGPNPQVDGQSGAGSRNRNGSGSGASECQSQTVEGHRKKRATSVALHLASSRDRRTPPPCYPRRTAGRRCARRLLRRNSHQCVSSESVSKKNVRKEQFR